jgi:hypothetical protein
MGRPLSEAAKAAGIFNDVVDPGQVDDVACRLRAR